MFNSPRDVSQINTLNQHLGLGSQLEEWYQDAPSVPFGHLFIDLTTKTVDLLRYCSNSGSVPLKSFLPARIETSFWTMSIQYVFSLPISENFSQKLRKQFILNCPEKLIQFLSKCLANLLRGEPHDLRKENV